jgi:hypothetical protein
MTPFRARRSGRRPRVVPRVILALIGALVTSPGVAAQAMDEVESLRVHVDVARDGSIRVTERIRVRSETVFRHGLLRYYATTRRRPAGIGWMQLPFEVRSATSTEHPRTSARPRREALSGEAASASGPAARFP